MSQSVSGDPLDLDAIEQSDPVLVSNVIPALVAEVRSLRQENEQLRTERDHARAEWHRHNERADAFRAELADLRAKIARVYSLCNVVRTLQKPDPDTGDRAVSFFALLDALDPDDAALSGSGCENQLGPLAQSAAHRERPTLPDRDRARRVAEGEGSSPSRSTRTRSGSQEPGGDR